VTDERGFTLIEAIVSTTVVVVAVLSMVRLITMSIGSNQTADRVTVGSILAMQKLEQLRSLEWGFDAVGLPLSDTSSDLTAYPTQPSGGRGLSPSPLRALQSNNAGYCDFLDAFGHTIPAGSNAIPAGTAYVRRWAVDPLPSNPDALLLQVLVTPWRTRGAADTDPADRAGWRLPGEARLVAVKTRKAD
jgi:type II secretory pathway pseudopilin PulG